MKFTILWYESGTVHPLQLGDDINSAIQKALHIFDTTVMQGRMYLVKIDDDTVTALAQRKICSECGKPRFESDLRFFRDTCDGFILPKAETA